MGQKTPNLTKAGAGTLEKKLVNIRILGHLLVIGPTDTAREHVGRMVLADVGGGFDEIINRGWFYDKFFLRSCKFSPSRGLLSRLTPKPSSSQGQNQHHPRLS